LTNAPALSVVLPCRNQADHIGPVLTRYLDALAPTGIDFELVVVPNASTDATLEVALDLARMDQRLRVVANPKGGWGRSVRVGLEAARGGLLCYTNTARTDPMLLPDFVRQHDARSERLVKACRVARNAPLRQFGSHLYNFEARVLFGVRSSDVNGTPKVFAADFFRSLHLTSDGDLLDLELMRAAQRRRLEVVEIPVAGFKRHGGKSSTTLKSAWKMYVGAMGLRLKACA
jgi:glycosyltransferase involved in cell wall biosynthesis